MKNSIVKIIPTLLILITPAVSSAGDYCTPRESWNWASVTPPVEEFQAFLAGKRSSIRAFSEALSLRRLTEDVAHRAFAEYWISRALFSAGLAHLAQSGFVSLLRQDIQKSTLPFQKAALGCLLSIHEKHGGDPFERDFLIRMNRLPEKPTPLIRRAAIILYLQSKEAQTPDLFELIKDGGVFESLATGITAATNENHTVAISSLGNFFLHLTENADRDFFRPYLDRAHLLLARSYYHLGKTQEAIHHYQAVHRNSNERVHSLSELSWAYLMDEQYRESIGVGIGLQSGALKQTFSPEAMMVTAMALNEMCRFPESLNVIHSFRKSYLEPYNWLKANEKSPQRSAYRNAVGFAKKSPEFLIPSRIGSEWMRSPIFLTNQEQINLYLKERDLSEQLSVSGKTEQKTIAHQLVMEVRDLKEKLRLAKIRLKPGEAFPTRLQLQITAFKTKLLHFRRLKNGGPFWRRMLTQHQNASKSAQLRLIGEISTEIDSLNTRMLRTLEEIAENNELIEVEILNGASEDIIWQNAHPEYKEVAQSMKNSGSTSAAEKVWNWGTTQSGFDGRGEIWEDEIGSLSADLYDNCENKEKYLAIERSSYGS